MVAIYVYCSYRSIIEVDRKKRYISKVISYIHNYICIDGLVDIKQVFDYIFVHTINFVDK